MQENLNFNSYNSKKYLNEKLVYKKGCAISTEMTKKTINVVKKCVWVEGGGGLKFVPIVCVFCFKLFAMYELFVMSVNMKLKH